MTDYTPTTEEVQLHFRRSVSERDGVDVDGAFSRWMNEVKAQVWDECLHTPICTCCDVPHNPYRQGETE